MADPKRQGQRHAQRDEQQGRGDARRRQYPRRLCRTQESLLRKLGTSYTSGLSTARASSIRSTSPHHDGGALNVVPPPVNCPRWVCCLLPCIKHVPSMRAHRSLEPDDAEVCRDGRSAGRGVGRWVRYDAASLVRGDVVRLSEGDVVPADCVVLSLGMDRLSAAGDDDRHCIDDQDESHGQGQGQGQRIEDCGEDDDNDDILEVDVSAITGESAPRTSFLRKAASSRSSSSAPSRSRCCDDDHDDDNDQDHHYYYYARPTNLLYGGKVLRGSCIAVVTACGPRTVLGRLIRQGMFPPRPTSSGSGGDALSRLGLHVEYVLGQDDNDNDDAELDLASGGRGVVDAKPTNSNSKKKKKDDNDDDGEEDICLIEKVA